MQLTTRDPTEPGGGAIVVHKNVFTVTFKEISDPKVIFLCQRNTRVVRELTVKDFRSLATIFPLPRG